MPPIRRSGARPERSTGSRRVVAGRANRSARDDTAAVRPEDADVARPEEPTTTDVTPVEDAGAGEEVPAEKGATGRRWTRRLPTGRAAVALASVLLVLGLVAGVLGGLMLTDRMRAPFQQDAGGNSAFVDAPGTDEVREAATSAVQRLVAIDHTSLDRYHDSLGEFLTPELITELDRTWPTLRDTYVQSKLKVEARVTEVGVSYLQGDQAEVLLVQDVSTTRDGQAAGSTTGTYLVTMTRVDGVWKLSKIPDLPS